MYINTEILATVARLAGMILFIFALIGIFQGAYATSFQDVPSTFSGNDNYPLSFAAVGLGAAIAGLIIMRMLKKGDL